MAHRAGYDRPRHRGSRIEVNKDEAERMGDYRMYSEEGSMPPTVQSLKALLEDKAIRDGQRHVAGRRRMKPALRKLLTNIVYLGKVTIRARSTKANTSIYYRRGPVRPGAWPAAAEPHPAAHSRKAHGSAQGPGMQGVAVR